MIGELINGRYRIECEAVTAVARQRAAAVQRIVICLPMNFNIDFLLLFPEIARDIVPLPEQKVNEANITVF